MICPSCGRRVPDEAITCPSCHASLDVTRKLSLTGATWCPACGALVAPGVSECPKCGTTVREHRPERRRREIDLPDIGNTGMMDALGAPGETGAMTRIESAIPPEDDAALGTRRVDRLPRTRAIVLAALLAVVVVGGAALLITHPWNPEATRISATTPADTSMQGFPGFLESLTGQDSAGGGEVTSAAELLSQEHERLGELAESVGESEELLKSDGVSAESTDEQRAEWLDEAEEVSIEVSNLISEVSSLDDGTNTEAVDSLVTLGSWLRNRCDILTSAWELAAASDDIESDAAAIVSELSSSRDYARRFEQQYDLWTPEGSQPQD